MAQIDDYLNLIPLENGDRPKFIATVSLTTGAFVDINNALQSMIGAYDLDTAVGDQLDVIGQWVGLSREVTVPINTYFSFNVFNLGFNQGNWRGPFDPIDGITVLDDDTYRLMLKAKIAANSWDSTIPGFNDVISMVFEGTGTIIFLVDNQDMSMDIYIAGTMPSALQLALLKEGYLPLKPEGVRVNGYHTSSVSGAPLFGFNINTLYVSGFNTGAWSTSL